MINHKIIYGDSLKILTKIKSSSVDLIFADPLYNLQLKTKLNRPDNSNVNAVNDNWDKFKNFEDYDKFNVKTWLKIQKVLKKDGAIWVIGTCHNIFELEK